jgi:ribosome biogenesis GTPase A
MYRILKATFTNAKMKNNSKNVLAKAMAISKTINKQKKKMKKKLIPANLVGMPNTRGNAAFARSLAN